MDCPCGSGRETAACCAPILAGERPAATPEELMRARYTAYTCADIDFIVGTMHPDRREDTDRDGILDWAENSEWHGLEILGTAAGGPDDTTGEVEFVAGYTYDGEPRRHHERATFTRVDGVWYFDEGEKVPSQPYVRETPKLGRNDPCSCGSGRKFKKCCGA